MAKRSAIEKQKRRERLVALKYEKRQELKRIVKSLDSSDEDRQRAQDDLCRLPRNSSPIRLRNRCQISGRPRGYMRKFQMSRNLFRELAGFGMVPGLTKSSW